MHKNRTEVPQEKIKKVKTFLDLEQKIQSFKAEHFEIFQEFAELLRRRNDALEDAEMEVRAKEVSCGPFTICGEQTRIDVDRLFEELGEEDFLRVGGSIETKRVFDIDRRKFEAMLTSNVIPQEVAENCYSRTFKYKAPRKAELP